MNFLRLRLAELFRLVWRIFAGRSPHQDEGPHRLEIAPEKMAAGLCLIAESLGSSETAVLDVLREARIEIRRANDQSDIPRLVSERMPGFVIAKAGPDTARLARALHDAGYKGPLQPVGNASLHGTLPPPGLRILPAIAGDAVSTELSTVLRDDAVSRCSSNGVNVDLGLAIRKGWLQFWYLPKIDMLRGQLQGAELIPRVHHPRYGILAHDCFERASPNDLRLLGFSAIKAAVKDWKSFLRLGFNMEFAINFPVEVFDGHEVAAVVDGIRPSRRCWKGLRIELDADILAPKQIELENFRKTVRAEQVTLVLDRVVSAGQIAQINSHFTEAKLNGTLIARCADDPEKQSEILAIQAEAARKNVALVATGVSRLADFDFLKSSCETVRYGQGLVFSPEVSRAQFIQLLRARAHHPQSGSITNARSSNPGQ
ncbi:EAL domain-containing protein [Chthonobacter rhizosphaerae]|uniref:EAL domain-containing protein n=1 Tax=Chthonobacter rhizosphaerae TaxID=2735553 RepID=UPI0015EF6660|nr:EAL domain-containing protein [Chthonobacter rhizosphaerae]